MIFNLVALAACQNTKHKKPKDMLSSHKYMSEKYHERSIVNRYFKKHSINSRKTQMNNVFFPKCRNEEKIDMSYKTILSDKINQRTTSVKLKFDTIKGSPYRFSNKSRYSTHAYTLI